MAEDLTARRRVRRTVRASADAVWAVVSDGWLYASWVVGASRVRSVDPDWPRSGSRIRHSVGLWPVVIDDDSLVLDSVPRERLVLQAKGWPLGEAKVDLTITDSSPHTCTVTIVEDAVAGPGLLVPRPVRQAAIAVRNHEALHRLALVAEGKSRERSRQP